MTETETTSPPVVLVRVTDAADNDHRHHETMTRLAYESLRATTDLLAGENDRLRAECSALRAENAELRARLLGGASPASPSPGQGRSASSRTTLR